MSQIRATLLSREVLPFYSSLAALAISALLLDALLHLADLVWIGRYVGILGTLLIIFSFGYSLRKRRAIKTGATVGWLRAHERMAWTGSLCLLVHGGIHFNAILGWLAIWAMLINVGSGLTGKFLLERARKRLAAERQQLQDEGLTPAQLEERLHLDALTLDLVKHWRAVHFPITLAFAVLALAHIISVFIFWGWR